MGAKRKGSSVASVADGNLDAYFKTTKAWGPLPNLKAGEVVSLTKYHLRQIGTPANAPAWTLRGKVVELVEVGGEVRWARIDWNDGSSRLVALSNLARPGANLRHCGC